LEKIHESLGRRQKGRKSLPPVLPRFSGEGATAAEVLNYLSRKFGMTIRPNRLGMTLQRHRRAGQLENRNQRWYLPPSA
jgi:hypothetical protein